MTNRASCVRELLPSFRNTDRRFTFSILTVADRVRPTLRCLGEDLGIEPQTLDVDLGTIDDPIVEEARRLAPDSPRGQKRILTIKSPLVYRLRHSDRRGATWVDPNNTMWLLAVEHRRDGAEDDAYEYFADLHRKGQLLPNVDDELRLRAERAAEILVAIRDDVVALCTEATFNLELGRPFVQEVEVAGRIPARIRAVPGDVHEIWLAISVREVDGDYYPAPWRDLVFGVVEEELRPDEWEWVTEFAGIALREHEIGRLYLEA